MKFKRPRRAGRGFAVVEITPLVDVIFLLLIFFVVSTTFVRTAAIEVDLPDASAVAGRVPDGIEVRVTASGAYAVNGDPVPGADRSGLLAALRQARRDAGGTPLVVVAADADARHETVVQVLDAARELGLTDVTLLTEAPSSAPDEADHD
ncbi:MAG: biopolymer transporter ExbD [Gammaproteobacteria bacterium]|nr:biopolymer transporter ExbD [Gammaproteobacteria bacterium]